MQHHDRRSDLMSLGASKVTPQTTQTIRWRDLSVLGWVGLALSTGWWFCALLQRMVGGHPDHLGWTLFAAD